MKVIEGRDFLKIAFFTFCVVIIGFGFSVFLVSIINGLPSLMEFGEAFLIIIIVYLFALLVGYVFIWVMERGS